MIKGIKNLVVRDLIWLWPVGARAPVKSAAGNVSSIKISDMDNLNKSLPSTVGLDYRPTEYRCAVFSISCHTDQ